MSWQLALQAPLEQDLSVFCQLLRARHVGHRVSEGKGQQQLWVADPETAQYVRELYAVWLQMPADNLEFLAQQTVEPRTQGGGWKQQLRRYPLTALVLLLTLLVAVWTGLGENLESIAVLTFNAVLIDGDRAWFVPLDETLASGQWWRLWSPVLIHFGWLHLAMNSMWFWELGRRIEQHQGSLFLLGFTLLAGLVSNVSQFVASGPAFFGGLSGVLYALLGFCWIYQRLCPVPAYHLPKGVVGMMLVWLVVCLLGVVTALGFGQIANAAHVSGLLTGCVAGALAGWVARGKRNSASH